MAITIPPTGSISPSPYKEEITIICGDETPKVPQLTFTGGCGNYNVVLNEETQKNTNSDDFMMINTWTVTDSCGNTEVFEQIVFVLQPKLEEINIDICVEDNPIDLISYLPTDFDTNGQFLITNGTTSLNGSIFNPIDLEIGEYKIFYNYNK